MKKYMITIVVLVIVIFVLYSTRDTDYTVVYGKDTISLIGKRFGHSDSMSLHRENGDYYWYINKDKILILSNRMQCDSSYNDCQVRIFKENDSLFVTQRTSGYKSGYCLELRYNKNYKIQDYKIMRYKAIPEIIRFPVN